MASGSGYRYTADWDPAAEIHEVKDAIRANAHINSMAEYERLYRLSLDDPQTFWGKQAERIDELDAEDTVEILKATCCPRRRGA